MSPDALKVLFSSMGCIGVAIEGPRLSVGMHRRIVAWAGGVLGGRRIGANVDGGGRIARPRRVTLVRGGDRVRDRDRRLRDPVDR